jgi:hypothetical protein
MHHCAVLDELNYRTVTDPHSAATRRVRCRSHSPTVGDTVDDNQQKRIDKLPVARLSRNVGRLPFAKAIRCGFSRAFVRDVLEA